MKDNDNAVPAPVYRIYKGESELPEGLSIEDARRWEFERMYADQIRMCPSSHESWVKRYDEALAEGYLYQELADTTLDKGDRVVMYYVELMTCKWFPYG